MNIPQIAWENFEEEEIHRVLTIFFEENNWKVYNIHKIQKSMEKGADLLVNADSKKIAISVKMKPRAKDRSQLFDLSERKEDEKYYIFIKDPAPLFKEHMEKFKEIKFLSKQSLNEWLFKLNPYLYTSLLLDNQKVIYELVKIKHQLCIFYEEYKKEYNKNKTTIKQTLDKDNLNILWRLKDDTASLYKIFRFIQYMFEIVENKKPNLEEDIIFVRGFVNSLKSIENYILNINNYFQEFYEKNKSFVHYAIYQTKDRSLWFSIFNFEPLIPKYVKMIFQKRENMKSSEKLNSFENANELSYDKFNILSLIAEKNRILANFMIAIESFVDYLFYF
jgi:hypothetical protein